MKTLQPNPKILMHEMMKCFFSPSSCSSTYSNHLPQSQSSVNDSLKLIPVHFLKRKRDRSKNRSKIRERNRHRAQIRKVWKKVSESLESKKNAN